MPLFIVKFFICLYTYTSIYIYIDVYIYILYIYIYIYIYVYIYIVLINIFGLNFESRNNVFFSFFFFLPGNQIEDIFIQNVTWFCFYILTYSYSTKRFEKLWNTTLRIRLVSRPQFLKRHVIAFSKSDRETSLFWKTFYVPCCHATKSMQILHFCQSSLHFCSIWTLCKEINWSKTEIK